jgi:membrane protease YdiL (CAAX protease family)
VSRAAETATNSDRRIVLKELVFLALAALIPMRILKEAVDAGAWEILLVGVPLLFIYAPVYLCRRRGVDSDTYRLHIPSFRDGAAWWRAIRINLILFAIITVPWLVGYHCYYTYGSQFLPLPTPVPGSGLPDGLLTIVLFQLFFVAVPEEFFYRGYFQTRLNEVYPRKWLIFGVPMGWGSVVACLFFAFGHTVVLFQWWHFATFFPGMVFAWLREKTDGVIAGAFFHAGCNIGIVTLDTWYGII